ncbi:FBPase-domain-containing protein [Cadophora sp. DSE1049]|nr:FBPase-domain-containing protein [Cadophora sp. DSE1049]
MATNGPVQEEKINTDIITLTRFLTEEQSKHKEATGDFTLLCHALQFSFKSIAYYIRRATLINLTGLAGSSNTTGDDQKKLDVIGNDLFIAAMRSSGKCAVLVSEEEEEAIYFPEHEGARYAVACDPIDGSSNLDAGVSVGTIFGIHKLPEGSKGTKEDLLKPGTELVAAGFTMYGASAQLVITMKGSTVNGFTMDNALGEFILTHPNMRMPKSRAIYSVNEGNSLYWEDSTKEYFNSLKYPTQEGGKPYSARYIGSMVADAYRTLLYGGIFAYPADKKSPKGKLRILYECAPMAMVFENAGGQALDSKMNRLMEVVPAHIHDRSGIFMGSYDEMEKVKSFHNSQYSSSPNPTILQPTNLHTMAVFNTNTTSFTSCSSGHEFPDVQSILSLPMDISTVFLPGAAASIPPLPIAALPTLSTWL